MSDDSLKSGLGQKHFGSHFLNGEVTAHTTLELGQEFSFDRNFGGENTNK